MSNIDVMHSVSETIRIMSARASYKAQELLCKDPYGDIYIYGVKKEFSDFMIPIAVNTNESNIDIENDTVMLILTENIQSNLTVEEIHQKISSMMRKLPVLPLAETSLEQDEMIFDFYEELRSVTDADWQIKMDDMLKDLVVQNNHISI